MTKKTIKYSPVSLPPAPSWFLRPHVIESSDRNCLFGKDAMKKLFEISTPLELAYDLLFTVIGGILYYVVIVIVLWLRLNSNDLKLFTAIVVALFLAVPYLRERRISSFAKFKRKGAKSDA